MCCTKDRNAYITQSSSPAYAYSDICPLGALTLDQAQSKMSELASFRRSSTETPVDTADAQRLAPGGTLPSSIFKFLCIYSDHV